MNRIEEDGRVFGELDNGARARVASDRVEINMYRDDFGDITGVDLVFRNKAYTGFGGNQLPLSVLGSTDVPDKIRDVLFMVLTDAWMLEYSQNQIFEIPNNTVEVIDEN